MGTTAQLIARQRVWDNVHLDDYPCAACALYEMKQMRITSLKIVGRGNTTVRKLADVSFFKTLLEQSTLWPVLHVDGGLRNIFEWGYNGRQFSDPPMFQKAHYVSTSFGTMGQ